ncbi:MAG TPA: hypothetical protein VMT15_07035 [Bryobacteraceae bacterium]|nr:hypothetical protein [Bryobacteraceae bacterium]
MKTIALFGILCGLSMQGQRMAAAVKSAPYSAQEVSEDVQVLADGNRIVNTTINLRYRDSQGRERSDNNVGSDGVAMSVFIYDPVEGVKYTLQPEDKIAVKTFLPKSVVDEPKVAAKMDLESILKAKVEPIVIHSTGGGGSLSPTLPLRNYVPSQSEAEREDLGTQMMEGVRVEGARRTNTIPAGRIGNEQPIVIVMERWFSPDLHVLVMSTRTDPRTGTNTYKLTNINRGEPAPTLFQVPPDYALKDITRPSSGKQEEDR